MKKHFFHQKNQSLNQTSYKPTCQVCVCHAQGVDDTPCATMWTNIFITCQCTGSGQSIIKLKHYFLPKSKDFSLFRSVHWSNLYSTWEKHFWKRLCSCWKDHISLNLQTNLQKSMWNDLFIYVLSRNFIFIFSLVSHTCLKSNQIIPSPSHPQINQQAKAINSQKNMF